MSGRKVSLLSRKLKADILRLYNEGLTDKEIAEKLRVTQSTVNFRRHKMGLINNYWETHEPFDEDIFLKLYKEGKVDSEIADRMNTTAAAVNYQRNKRNLRSNYKTEKQKKRMIKMEKKLSEKAMKIYKNLGNPLGVAQNQGFTVFAVANHNNIPMNEIKPLLLNLESAGLIRIENKNENLKKATVFKVK